MSLRCARGFHLFKLQNGFSGMQRNVNVANALNRRKIAGPSTHANSFSSIASRFQTRSSAVNAKFAAESQIDPPLLRVATPQITQAFLKDSTTTRLIFEHDVVYDISNIWLRDNCQCAACVHPDTKQKLVETPQLSISVKPQRISLEPGVGSNTHAFSVGSNASTHLSPADAVVVEWTEDDGEQALQPHRSVYDQHWLFNVAAAFRRGKTPDANKRVVDLWWNKPILWDTQTVLDKLPSITYDEYMTDAGLFKWLDSVRNYGIAFATGVPCTMDALPKFVERFAYVKETSYGKTFQVRAEPETNAHLAFTGRELALHTDMNYRENSPGLQLLHCLEAVDVSSGNTNRLGGESAFADGFAAAEWLKQHHPAEFSMLSTIRAEFAINNKGLRYSCLHNIINVEEESGLRVKEIHVNNRTMQPLQTHPSLVLPFYHAYQRFCRRLADPSMQLRIQMRPGDLVVFNNRRILHGRGAFDPARVKRHLQGCYVDIDEAYCMYDQLIRTNANLAQSAAH